ncbi:hypothetical protein Tco_1401587 [Tanacetum coccineum]
MDMQEVILFYNGLEVPTRKILDSKGAIPTKTVADAKLSKHNLIILEEKSRRLMKRYMMLRWDVSFVRDSTTRKTVHIKKKVKPLKKHIILNLVYLSNKEGNIKQQLQDSYQRNNANPSYQERRQSMEESLSKFMNESAKRHEENSNMIKEIQATIDAAIRIQGASIKTLEIQIGQMSKVLQERGFGSLPSSTKTNLRYHVKSISTAVETDTTLIRCIGSSQYAKGLYGLQYMDTYRATRASVSVMSLSTYLNLGLGELAHTKLTVELAYRTVKHPKGIAENVLVGIELDLEARLLGETLILNRPLDPLYGDYIKLNDLNEPLELKGNQVDNLKPTIEKVYLVSRSFMVSHAHCAADMIGISNKGVDILAEDVVKDAEIIMKWEDQFVGIKNINANHVKHMIRNSRVADMNFKLNIIVLFTSQTSIGAVTFGDVWKSVRTAGSVPKQIASSKMMYVDGPVCKDFRVGRKRPPTTMWTKELLKERELVEIKSRGIGKGELEGPYVEEQDDPMTDNLKSSIRSKLKIIPKIKERISSSKKRLNLFKNTVFGNWLDLDDTNYDNHLLNYVLHHQRLGLSKSVD